VYICPGMIVRAWHPETPKYRWRASDDRDLRGSVEFGVIKGIDEFILMLEMLWKILYP
jgi:hypothetical protein